MKKNPNIFINGSNLLVSSFPPLYRLSLLLPHYSIIHLPQFLYCVPSSCYCLYIKPTFRGRAGQAFKKWACVSTSARTWGRQKGLMCVYGIMKVNNARRSARVWSAGILRVGKKKLFDRGYHFLFFIIFSLYRRFK